VSDRALGVVAFVIGWVVLVAAVGPGLALRLFGGLCGMTLIGFGAVLLTPPYDGPG
jgi:hypothetical protein